MCLNQLDFLYLLNSLLKVLGKGSSEQGQYGEVGDSYDNERPKCHPVDFSEQPEIRLAIDHQATVRKSDENISEDHGKTEGQEVEACDCALEDHEYLAVQKSLLLCLLQEKEKDEKAVYEPKTPAKVLYS